MINRPLTAPLEGQKVSLVPIDPEHCDGLFVALDHEDVWRWIPNARPGDSTQFAKIFDWFSAENDAGRMGTFVSLDSEGAPIGMSSYLAIRDEHYGLEIGFSMVSPPHWGTGANIEAKLLMLARAFDDLGCQRVEFKTDARNERSRGALAAIPAQFEGIFRKHMNTHYGVRDSAYYAVTIDDWPTVRANLESRLK